MTPDSPLTPESDWEKIRNKLTVFLMVLESAERKEIKAELIKIAYVSIEEAKELLDTLEKRYKK
ncbi:hypothetical protein Phi4:1_gp175 [Cellulophaga phage phi4:1]|uniref:Uncharacterized protein n=5 Tax=Lightbulbvirus TaxID=1918522 RepID=A0A0S2MWV4_9CAUD|nr:hypothetical protein Phi4:1_gp175 [Cellulophaga phage phi4:1]YP_008241674.1 hypothetical protein Phi17:2_gp179 [Cellulophaga phage phi17:2]ALO80184.1 hypothetical protein Phi4113_175 [Cellulophaga phage phi4:1_13]ALO80381.1 hypothetical protein Phi4118_175 [Cellulophaga phage phi4:1_18]ALO80582.1 hypothetical protein Phi17218_179 [Cellulophaga phage phi17:2_18]AGO47712.1 hypothetical protein Phi17:2_gp179 [Cellulophaga phage phi17:2]AGO49588.1 hypothetical protein Phi4:1_gp175 [Cellulophag